MADLEDDLAMDGQGEEFLRTRLGQPLTETQKRFLRDHIDELWAAFVANDPDVVGATCCSDCINKNVFLGNFYKITDPTGN